eukprot:TRINITY_DN10518_c0_g1_i1.p1 TRINITY_DN10518_c0_g1~~TRINITY_DN10518_c0_g1_i1.p1  ORF type:complete len:514 (-),score=153.08 TRINITY_DN10518_c0_g1_i1:27-1523(-)
MSLLGIEASRNENFSEWFIQVVTRAELIEYTEISGCYVLRPRSFAIWEAVQSFFDAKIKASGVKNAYFPLFVSKRALEAEEDHIDGFAPEVAWVTKSGDTELNEHIAVRPTSETIMYPLFSKWIRSHRDLPLRLNQWCNVVRWEFKHAVPFLRSREFLWQEGHSAYCTQEEADEEVLEILGLYEQVYQDLLAVPIIKGKKTNLEKFAGGDYTTTCEAFIAPNGRAIQAATSHSLGQNFSKMFDITYENEEQKPALAFQNSWGLSTRCIGVMIMVHGDDQGLVLPPRVAPDQLVLVPIFTKKNIEEVSEAARAIIAELRDAGIRAIADLATGSRPGRKYSHYETRGVPVRLELGGRDLAKGTVMLHRRDLLTKKSYPREGLVDTVLELLEDIQQNMFNKAKEDRDAHLSKSTNFDDFLEELNQGNIVSVPFCETSECEEQVKTLSAERTQAAAGDDAFELTGKAKSLCIPFEQEPLEANQKCFACDLCAKSWCIFGRSY